VDPEGRAWTARAEEAAATPAARYPWRFFTVNTDAMAALLADPRINTSPLAVRLLGALPQKLAWDRWERVDQTSLAAELGTHQPSISIALQRLVAAGAVEHNGKRGHGARWRLNPRWGWRGTPSAWWRNNALALAQAAQQEADQLSKAEQPSKTEQAELRIISYATDVLPSCSQVAEAPSQREGVPGTRPPRLPEPKNSTEAEAGLRSIMRAWGILREANVPISQLDDHAWRSAIAEAADRLQRFMMEGRAS
jgi:hypothetical protein